MDKQKNGTRTRWKNQSWAGIKWQLILRPGQTDILVCRLCVLFVPCWPFDKQLLFSFWSGLWAAERWRFKLDWSVSPIFSWLLEKWFSTDRLEKGPAAFCYSHDETLNCPTHKKTKEEGGRGKKYNALYVLYFLLFRVMRSCDDDMEVNCFLPCKAQICHAVPPTFLIIKALLLLLSQLLSERRESENEQLGKAHFPFPFVHPSTFYFMRFPIAMWRFSPYFLSIHKRN